jgi:hypothetical protein
MLPKPLKQKFRERKETKKEIEELVNSEDIISEKKVKKTKKVGKK